PPVQRPGRKAPAPAPATAGRPDGPGPGAGRPPRPAASFRRRTRRRPGTRPAAVAPAQPARAPHRAALLLERAVVRPHRRAGRPERRARPTDLRAFAGAAATGDAPLSPGRATSSPRPRSHALRGNARRHAPRPSNSVSASRTPRPGRSKARPELAEG